MTTPSTLEGLFGLHLRVSRLPPAHAEYRFDTERKWRFDFAWPDVKVAVEIQGGTWNGGKHGRGSGIEKDAEKLSAAAIAGWRVLIVTGNQVRSGQALAWTEQALTRQDRAEGGEERNDPCRTS